MSSLPTRLYHGCSRATYKKMETEGIESLAQSSNYKRWLCAYGLYLFVDNPLLAYSFALEKSRWQEWRKYKHAGERMPIECDPVVLAVDLNPAPNSLVLDLTTPIGMERLFQGHMALFNQLRSDIGSTFDNLGNDISLEDKVEYDSSLLAYTTMPSPFFCEDLQYKALFKLLTEKAPTAEKKEILRRTKFLLTAWRKDGRFTGWEQFSYDCFVLTELVDAHKYRAIIAAVQEGSTYHSMYEHPYRCPGTVGFKGIRLRDHTEVCVTDLDLVASYHEHSFDPNTFDPAFLGYLCGFQYFHSS